MCKSLHMKTCIKTQVASEGPHQHAHPHSEIRSLMSALGFYGPLVSYGEGNQWSIISNWLSLLPCFNNDCHVPKPFSFYIYWPVSKIYAYQHSLTILFHLANNLNLRINKTEYNSMEETPWVFDENIGQFSQVFHWNTCHKELLPKENIPVSCSDALDVLTFPQSLKVGQGEGMIFSRLGVVPFYYISVVLN